jgi:hypothetical protein
VSIAAVSPRAQPVVLSCLVPFQKGSVGMKRLICPICKEKVVHFADHLASMSVPVLSKSNMSFWEVLKKCGEITVTLS